MDFYLRSFESLQGTKFLVAWRHSIFLFYTINDVTIVFFGTFLSYFRLGFKKVRSCIDFFLFMLHYIMKWTPLIKKLWYGFQNL